MRSEGDEEPIPQTEEDITAIEWLDPEKVRQILPLSYPSIREVAKKAGLI
jgi:hypothetical protein